MTANPSIQCDLCVIGSGMAGLSAALFSARRGLSTVVVGRTGEIIFATGLLDLMALHPVETGEIWDDPWACIARLKIDRPEHPLARVPAADIRTAFDALTEFLASTGLPYAGHPDRNVRVLTSVGSLKPTFRVPATMWAGIEACQNRPPCLLVDFHGLKGFSAIQIAAAIGPRWPGLRTARIGFSDAAFPAVLFPERLARALALASNREKLAEAIGSRLDGEQAVGLPAILGIDAPAEVLADVQQRLGVKVFEIPTMPPGVTGLRLKEAFESGLRHLGVRLLLANRVSHAEMDSRGGFRLHVEGAEPEVRIESRAAILATGRFMSGGLVADRWTVREPLFHLPVHQPESREQWHREEFLDPRGHAVNRAGIQTDELFRPLDTAGRPLHRRLFAAGSILAHQDWMRSKCGSGLAIATAYAAVQNIEA